MFGTVTKKSRYTRFYLEIQLDNGCIMYETQVVYNWELDNNPAGYGITLNYLTKRLEKRLNDRHQLWMETSSKNTP